MSHVYVFVRLFGSKRCIYLLAAAVLLGMDAMCELISVFCDILCSCCLFYWIVELMSNSGV